MVKTNLTKILWKNRFICKNNKIIKILSLIIYILPKNTHLTLFKVNVSFLVLKTHLLEIINVYYYTKRIYFYPGKNPIIIYIKKHRNFILLSAYLKMLVVIVWECRYIINNIKYNYLSLLFKKYYLNKIPYLMYKDCILSKETVHFNYSKQSTYIEYQAYILPYIGQYHNLFDHIEKHIMKTSLLVNSLKIDLILFIKNKVLPRKMPLSFSRIKNIIDINECIQIARKRFLLAVDDKYTDEYIANHISIRLYFKNIPTKMELLFIEDYSYYILKNIEKNIIQLLTSNPQVKSVKNVEDHALESDYDSHEINFYINNEK